MTGLSGAAVVEGIVMIDVRDEYEVSYEVGAACFEEVGTGCEGKADGLFLSVSWSDGSS